MKIFIVMLYIGMLLLFTCTESLFLFITEHELHFQFTRYPNFADFFLNDLSSLNDITYVIQKLGHFICFFFLAMLLYWALQHWLLVVVISVGFAFLTEVVQLFFSRSGRLLDVVYDVAGLMVFIGVYLCFRFVEWLFSKVFISEVRRH
ncbi:VanZ family protein [Metabacillus sp. FJAT-53654]|uniref:VanZ family protein n=1 Tax=Metabacillus rhizosphaerae TaxID=3117747 RepID=A0ABZ2MWH6_9BACI